MFGIDPRLLAMLASGVAQAPPGQPDSDPRLRSLYPIAPDGTDPLALKSVDTPADLAGGTTQPAPTVDPRSIVSSDAPDNSVNDNINSVGRPYDLSQAEQEALTKDQGERAKRFKKARREAKGEALLALGASLMSAPSFGQGISQGLVAYRQALDAGLKRAKPQHESLSGGAFERVTDPTTGESTYERTPVADYEMDKLNAITGRQESVANIKGGYTLDVQGLKNEGAMDRTKFEWGSRKTIAEWNNNTRKQIAEANNATSIAVARIRGAYGSKPNSGMERQITELTDTTTGISNTLSMASPVLNAINNGSLKFDLLSNARHKFALATGAGGNEQTVLFAQYSQLKESLRNALLLANKGVQTDGDADRAMAEIEAGSGDTAAIKRNLGIVINSLNRRLGAATGRLNDISGYRAPLATPDSTDLKKKYGLE